MNSKFVCMLPVVFAALAPVTAPQAHAGTFSVSPVRLQFSARDRAATLTVANEGDEEVVIQTRVSTWGQAADGRDSLSPTEDLLLMPPVLKIAPKSRQVVRLARIAPPDLSRQQTYRLFLQQIPEGRPSQTGLQANVNVVISLPVFVTPPTARPDMRCMVGRHEGQLEAVCQNSGTAYAQVRTVTLKRGGEVLAGFNGATYILQGASRSSRLKAESEVRAGAAQLSVVYDDGKSQEFDVAVP